MKYYKPKPSKKAIINNLELFCIKNEHLRKLIKTFGLIVDSPTLEKPNINKQLKKETMTKKTEVTEKKETPKFSVNQPTEEKKESNIIFPEGVNFLKKHEQAPDYVVGSVFIKIDVLNNWLINNSKLLHQNLNTSNNQIEATLKLELLTSKEGKIYFKVNTYGLQ
jgi:hypothetical protein